jgi:hypothetical protein
MKNKKGQLGLDTVQKTMIVFLILAVIGVTIFLTMSSLLSVADNIDTESTTVTNETVTALTEIPQTLVYYVQRNSECTQTSQVNATGGEEIADTNFTFSSSNCGLQFVDGSEYNNTNIKVTYIATYTAGEIPSISSNVSNALADFFSNTSTIFAILVVVVIILAITIIIVAVRQFSGGTVGTI